MWPSPTLVRAGRVADADQIAEVQILGWQWAYRGLLPQDYLDNLEQTQERRRDIWVRQLATTSEERIWVAGASDLVVGFAATGISQDEDCEAGTGELRAIYIRPEVASTGVGRALLSRAMEDMAERHERATLWVLAGNERAIRFYEIAGWKADGAIKGEDRPDFTLHQVRYAIELSR